MKAYAYILECADGTFYTGWTNDLEKRVASHNEGKGAKYTRCRRPVRLRYYEEFTEKAAAQSREWHIKQLTHREKFLLMAEGERQREQIPMQITEMMEWKKGHGQMAEQRVMLTEEGYKKLEEKLHHLKSVRRIEVAKRLNAAIALGDLSENSEYEDAKNEQAFVEGEILDLEAKIRNSEIIKSEAASDVVQMGNTVVIKDLEFNEEETYTLVGSAEADPSEFKISNESPVGAAIYGQKVGTVVEVHAPAGLLKYQIMQIKA